MVIWGINRKLKDDLATSILASGRYEPWTGNWKKEMRSFVDSWKSKINVFSSTDINMKYVLSLNKIGVMIGSTWMSFFFFLWNPPGWSQVCLKRSDTGKGEINLKLRTRKKPVFPFSPKIVCNFCNYHYIEILVKNPSTLRKTAGLFKGLWR